ncbi:MAG: 2-amino-4-hydroxy-6-hydroxymethyldihydropteridine diphosphokinase [Spirochaetia bacterium]|nr:2-amino-4-hydroxy-6-hydroxymethyldihydropteridine diphosphokinase [Spirochaetia bacterium]
METIYLSLGTNMGNRRENLKQAIFLMGQKAIVIEVVSALYESEPVGLKTQPDFYNIALKAATDLNADELLTAVQSIELDMGRIKAEKWGPRIIDIDILFYGSKIIKSKKLIVPHPEMTKRLFVLKPLVEIAPDFSHPATGLTAADMIRNGSFTEKVDCLGEFR